MHFFSFFSFLEFIYTKKTEEIEDKKEKENKEEHHIRQQTTAIAIRMWSLSLGSVVRGDVVFVLVVVGC